MPPIPYRISVKDHPGSSLSEIASEPNWSSGHEHRIGFHNRQDRVPGLTHSGDENDSEPTSEEDSVHSFQGDRSQEEFLDRAQDELSDLKAKEARGQLVNFRDLVLEQEDFHLRRPEVHSKGWRYVLDTTEEWVKETEEWPANIERKRKAEEAEKEKKKKEDEKVKKGNQDETSAEPKDNKDDREGHGTDKTKERNDGQVKQEHDMKRESGEDQDKHNDAYAADSEASSSDEDSEPKTEYQKLREKYSPQEISLLRSLQHEKDYIYNLKQNDGHMKSPVANAPPLLSISEDDQFTPDNWIPRSSKMIRLTGKHPLNSEYPLTDLFKAGLYTPNELHYIRNHGAVPHLLWETHKLEVTGLDGKQHIEIGMDELKSNFEAISIQVAIACDGNRRKELNMVKRSKGFSWGAGAISCAFWKGPLMRDVLLAAGVPEKYGDGERRWVNFEGADDPSEGKYSTCLPFEYVMNKTNDVILAYAMNDVPLPPDHGHPLRVIIPGYVGGRNVKWLKRIWISDKENDSHYHIWDNRVLPAFITEKDGPFADVGFFHPSSACNEQNLNSVITLPAQGETISLDKAKKGATYRIEGYAYDGGGHEVQRVEVSLDGGDTWLYCIRKFPEAPIRHGNKFWTWLHWHIDVEIAHLVRSKSITVRCFNVFKNTQPKTSSWNTMGMMANGWYIVKPEISIKDDGVAAILFRHPTEPGTGKGGWMKLSESEKINEIKQQAGTPQKQFTREEIEKHNSENDCWLVVDGKVYDATSVLEWHPGGKAAITGHAGKVWQATTEEFNSIHDGYAQAKLKECILGVVTDKAKQYIKKTAEAAAKEAASTSKPDDVALEKHRWIPVKLTKRDKISADTRRYTFELPSQTPKLGLETCQHIQLGYHFKDKMLIRSYTPTRPVMPSEENGTFELVVKTYFPDEKQPGGALSNILDCMPIGEEIEVRGPTGEIAYKGNGKFDIEGKEHIFKQVTLILGGSGLTPGYALIARILQTEGDNTQIRVIDANKSEKDILLYEQMQDFASKHDNFKITHVLSHPSDEWKGIKGHVSADIIKEHGFPPDGGKDSVVFLCGPPAMIQKAALPALKDWGYEEEVDCFGF